MKYAVTAEEFAEAYRTFHRGDPPDRIEVGDQTWEDLDSELEAFARPAADLASVDRYVYDDTGDDDGSGDGFCSRCGTWQRVCP